jgi:hypothetical protein
MGFWKWKFKFVAGDFSDDFIKRLYNWETISSWLPTIDVLTAWLATKKLFVEPALVAGFVIPGFLIVCGLLPFNFRVGFIIGALQFSPNFDLIALSGLIMIVSIIGWLLSKDDRHASGTSNYIVFTTILFLGLIVSLAAAAAYDVSPLALLILGCGGIAALTLPKVYMHGSSEYSWWVGKHALILATVLAGVYAVDRSVSNTTSRAIYRAGLRSIYCRALPMAECELLLNGMELSINVPLIRRYQMVTEKAYSQYLSRHTVNENLTIVEEDYQSIWVYPTLYDLFLSLSPHPLVSALGIVCLFVYSYILLLPARAKEIYGLVHAKKAELERAKQAGQIGEYRPISLKQSWGDVQKPLVLICVFVFELGRSFMSGYGAVSGILAVVVGFSVVSSLDRWIYATVTNHLSLATGNVTAGVKTPGAEVTYKELKDKFASCYYMFVGGEAAHVLLSVFFYNNMFVMIVLTLTKLPTLFWLAKGLCDRRKENTVVVDGDLTVTLIGHLHFDPVLICVGMLKYMGWTKIVDFSGFEWTARKVPTDVEGSGVVAPQD